jgi:hypothetical protein
MKKRSKRVKALYKQISALKQLFILCALCVFVVFTPEKDLILTFEKLC